MTRLLITSPDAVAPSATERATAPGVPNQPTGDLKGNPMVEGETRAYAAKTRERAVRQLRDALDVVSEWVALIGQCAEMRVDSFETEDVLTDVAYREALGRYARLTAAVEWFNARGPVIEAGEL